MARFGRLSAAAACPAAPSAAGCLHPALLEPQHSWQRSGGTRRRAPAGSTHPPTRPTRPTHPPTLSLPPPPSTLQEFDEEEDEEEIEYLEEGDLGFDPDEEGDMEDYSGSEEEGSEEGGSSGGAPARWESLAFWVQHSLRILRDDGSRRLANNMLGCPGVSGVEATGPSLHGMHGRALGTLAVPFCAYPAVPCSRRGRRFQ